MVQSSSITYDKRSTHEGLIHGEVYFVDASVLHLREFVDVETTVERLLYVYRHWFRLPQINLCSTLSRFLYQEYLLEREALFQHS